MVNCKFCGSEIVCRFGYTKKGEQRFICNHCQRTFLDNNASEGMKYPVELVSKALELFYESFPVNKIRKQLQQTHGVEPNDVTIYRWVAKYTLKATKLLSQTPVATGPEWVAREFAFKLRERNAPKQWFWCVFDRTTKFLLAHHFSETRRAEDARTLMEKAVQRARKAPQTVVTDDLLAYLDGVELALGSYTDHVPAEQPITGLSIHYAPGMRYGYSNNVIRTFFTRETAKKFVEGWQAYYNFFRPCVSLGNRTPAEAAGADGTYKSWSDIVEAFPQRSLQLPTRPSSKPWSSESLELSALLGLPPTVRHGGR